MSLNASRRWDGHIRSHTYACIHIHILCSFGWEYLDQLLEFLFHDLVLLDALERVELAVVALHLYEVDLAKLPFSKVLDDDQVIQLECLRLGLDLRILQLQLNFLVFFLLQHVFQLALQEVYDLFTLDQTEDTVVGAEQVIVVDLLRLVVEGGHSEETELFPRKDILALELAPEIKKMKDV